MFGADSIPLGDSLGDLVPCADQLCSVEHMVRAEGPGAGGGTLVVRNPSGFSFEVMTDRCLDIGWADASDMPVAWRSGRGPVHSVRYESAGNGWTRSFPGGLLTTCGLESTGMPSVTPDGIEFGLHGRIGHTPAENVAWRLTDDGILIEGDVFEAALGRPRLRLHRRILADTRAARLAVEDEVCNMSRRPAGYMLRHHINLGYPLVAPGATVSSGARVVGAREDTGTSARTLPWTLDLDATRGEEVCYCLPAVDDACCETVVVSLSGLQVRIRQETTGWPWLILWRDPSPGVNVLGVEPSTSRDGGRVRAERDGEVRILESGETRVHRTWISVG